MKVSICSRELIIIYLHVFPSSVFPQNHLWMTPFVSTYQTGFQPHPLQSPDIYTVMESDQTLFYVQTGPVSLFRQTISCSSMYPKCIKDISSSCGRGTDPTHSLISF